MSNFPWSVDIPHQTKDKIKWHTLLILVRMESMLIPVAAVT